MSTRYLSLICLFSSLLFNSAWAAEIYRYVDKNGVTHFTDRAPDNSKRSIRVYTPESLNSVSLYKYVDRHGVVHFSDRALHRGYKIIFQGSLNRSVRAYKGPTKVHRKHHLYSGIVAAAAKRYDLDPALIHAMIHTESAYNPKAVSPKGATGLMQLMKATAKRYGVSDRTNATENVNGGARYLRDLLKMFNGNRILALAAYNAGEGAVKRYNRKIPPFKETQNYVSRVLALYESYRRYY